MVKKGKKDKLECDWVAIEQMFIVRQNKPREIAEIYDVNVETLSKRATKYGWVPKREERRKKELKNAKERHTRQLSQVDRIMQKMLNNIEKELDAERCGAYIQSGEALPDKYHSDAWKAAMTHEHKLREKEIDRFNQMAVVKEILKPENVDKEKAIEAIKRITEE